MKLTATMLRKIIAEEVSKTKTKKTLSEAITRITEDEMAAWKGGNWGYVAGDESGDDSEKFLHGYESGHPMDDEGNMIKGRMSGLKRMAEEICELTQDEDQFPAWVQDLVAQAHETLSHVHDYLLNDEDMRDYSGEVSDQDNPISLANESKKKGPSKKTAQKILKGTKTFKDKMKKVEKWADDPGAAAAWMMRKATGKWPNEK